MDIQLEMALAGVLLIATAVFAFWSLRGRRVGTEPHCRRCGYDLRGMPDGVNRCAECGADLSGSKAIVAGVVTNRKRWLWLSGVLLLATSVPTVSVVRQFREEGWTHLKPFWLLRWQLGSSNAAVRDDADIELFRRSIKGTLSSDEKLQIVLSAIHHDFGKAKLPPVVVDFSYECRVGQILSPEEWDALWRPRINPQLVMKKSFKSTEHPFADVRFPEVPQGHIVRASSKLESTTATLDGMPFKNKFPGQMIWALPPVNPGEHRLRILVSYEFANAGNRFGAAKVVSIEVSLDGDFVVEPRSVTMP